MQQIKLNGAEQIKRLEWENTRALLFKLNFKALNQNQLQQTGAFFINEGKNLFITYLVAMSVFEGHLTLGAMVAIQYIIGQLNGPVEQLVGFSQQAQDARISLERLNEIHQLEDEEPEGKSFVKSLTKDHSISVRGLSFSYPGSIMYPR